MLFVQKVEETLFIQRQPLEVVFKLKDLKTRKIGVPESNLLSPNPTANLQLATVPKNVFPHGYFSKILSA